MDDSLPPPPSSSPQDDLWPSPQPRVVRPPTPLGTVIAWLVIVALTAAVIVFHVIVKASAAQAGGDATAGPIFELQAKVSVGLALAMDKQEGDPKTWGDLQSAFRTASPAVQQALVVAGFELAGLDDARAQLERAAERLAEDPPSEGAEKAEAVQVALGLLYGADHPGDPPRVELLDEAQRDLLVEQLGWVGKLAVHPAGTEEREAMIRSVRRGLILAGTIVGIVAIAGVLGLAGLIICIVRAAMGALRSGLPEPAPDHGIYVETFAIWMVLFLVIQLGVALIAQQIGSSLLLSAGAFFLSLAALGWPVVRGIPWSRVRREIGWHLGRQPLLEPLWGIAGYAMTLPIIGVGVILMLLLMLVVTALGGAGPIGAEPPSHPIIGQVEPTWWTFVQILLVAAVAAPVVEETFFRGVLYRHLRDATRWWGTVGSILGGTAINAFIFAVIHPQGILAVPVLMSIAVGMTLAREWRGTLIPSMIMHAINNFLAMSLVFVIMGM